MSVATMYTMPTMIAPAVSIGMSLRWAANSIVCPIPLIVEDPLDRDDPAEQVADLDADDGDGRDQGVAQDVAAHGLEWSRPFIVAVRA